MFSNDTDLLNYSTTVIIMKSMYPGNPVQYTTVNIIIGTRVTCLSYIKQIYVYNAITTDTSININEKLQYLSCNGCNIDLQL